MIYEKRLLKLLQKVNKEHLLEEVLRREQNEDLGEWFDKLGYRREEVLRLGSLSITNLPNDLLIDFPELKYIDLGSNKIESIPEDFFQHNSNLTHVNLSGNKLRSLPDNLFKNQTQLCVLGLRANKLESLSDSFFQHLKNLEQVALDSNNLESKPKILEKLPKLKHISF